MKKFALILLVLLPLLWASFASPPPAFGATITVDTATFGIDGTDGACSISEAVDNSENGAVHADCVAGVVNGADSSVLTHHIPSHSPVRSV